MSPSPAVTETVPPNTAAPSIKRLASRGAFVAMVGYGGGQMLRLAGNVVLARLLTKEDFGLMALVGVFIQGLQMFSDVGIGPSVVQNRRGDEARFLNTVWTIQAIRGLAIWLIACLGAVPFARFYGEPSLIWLIPLAASSSAFAGLHSARLFTLQRHVRLGRLTLLDLGAQGISLTVMVVWALVHPSVVALAVGGIAFAVVKLIGSHLLLDGVRDRFAWDREIVRDVMSFGRWVFVSTLLTFLAMNADKLVFGKLVDKGLLGVYVIGAMLALTPVLALGHVIASVLFPVYSRKHAEGADLQEVFLRYRRPILVLGGAVLAMVIAGAPPLVRLLYLPKFEAAGYIAQLLAAGGWFSILEQANGAVLLTRGHSHLVAASHLAKLIGLAIGIPVGFWLYGFPGAVAGFAAAEAFKYAVAVIAVRKAGIRCLAEDGRAFVGFGLAILAGFAARALAADAPPFAQCLAVGATILLLASPLALAQWRAYRAVPTPPT